MNVIRTIKIISTMNFVVAGLLNYSSVVTVAGQMYKLIGGLHSTDNLDVKECLTRLDLEYKLKMIESIINQKLTEYYEKHKLTDNEIDAEMVIINKEIALRGNSDPVIIALYYLFDLTNKIHNELNTIFQTVNNYNNSWLKTIRRLDVNDNLRRLEKYVEILDQRFHTYLLLEKGK